MAAGGWSVPDQGQAEWLPVLDLPEPARQRRLTVLLRWLLLLPQFIVVAVLSVGASLAAIVGWFAALFTGRLPEPVARFLYGYVGYQTRVSASAMLLVDRYPPFALWAPADHPTQIELRPGKLNRLAVLFRIILMFPAAIIESVVSSGWFALSFLIWLVVLITGGMPRPLFEAVAATLRYSMRLNSYVFMLTSAYPKGLFGDAAYPQAETHSASRPLRLSGWGTAFLVLFLLAGVGTNIASSVGTTSGDDNPTVRTAHVPDQGVR
ncbi:DUF4389 domain-containing protein [Kitasatospora sp. MAP5-34]|uniref:DUF4389 domain-containing protein n=1 Tax=Kitasatospora sp. MAP5-34 TaxID=3035102 RepID=UPI00247619DB|nr:DUF4389 domain-containing protein [Kitasatospora sp. MAP5-34]MDH6576166.1 hypothetical protein [Kitasatospora sp. MAP5-34]